MIQSGMSSPRPSPSSRRTVRVDLGARSYDVVVGRGLIEQAGEILKSFEVRAPTVVITDRRVPGDHRSKLVNSLVAAKLQTVFLHKKEPNLDIVPGEPLVVDEGESTKSVEQVAKLLSSLATLKIPRTGTVVALGGGVIGDLAGFVAATYLRGVAFVQVPTTLLAMVDSSVGGKTGVNLPEGKNLVGAFHQPRLVVADLDTLATLPAREFNAGMAEVIKYGAIRDRALFDRVANGVTPQDDDLAEIVEKCVAIKARIVERDEFETKGERALLNFGHTLGHAIEKAGGYTRYLHGEAIALGLRAAAWLSVWHPETQLPEAGAKAIEQALLDNDLPLELDPDISRDVVLAALGNDKKVAADGGNRWVLLKKLGEAQSGYTVSPELVERALSILYPKT
jgi:3-dehydroquinate synthase